MLTEHGIQYAVHLVTNNFGNLVAKVCECLLRKGPLPFQSIPPHTNLTNPQVKNSLLVLIQHNCVQSFVLEEPGGIGKGPKFTTKYMVLSDNILHRARFPKFLAIVSQQFDKSCVELFEGLLQHGRLTLKQMLDKAAEQTQKDVNSLGMDAIRENLQKLLMAHFVERCPIPEPVLQLPDTEEVAGPKRSAKSAKMIVESETLEQRVVSAALPAESIRFALGMNLELTVDVEENKTNSPSVHPGEKRKHDALGPDMEGDDTQEQVLWRANFEEFLHQLRHKACIDCVRARLDDGAVIVFSAMLDASRNEEKKFKAKYSVPLSMNSIYEEVIKNERGRNMTFDHVRAVLVELSSHPPFVKAADESYRIDYKHIIEAAQTDEVESVVLKRYGGDAYRVFRLLSKDGKLHETDKISDSVFVEKKETANLLYKLWKDDYLHMEKLVVGTTYFLLWKVNKQNLWVQVLDEMFHTALNLSIRVAYEMDQHKEIYNVPPESRVGAIKEKIERLKQVRWLLEAAMVTLDDAIMLFHYF